MQNRKRNLEKMERVANALPDNTPEEAHGEAAKYIRDLIAEAEREKPKGEPKVKPATDVKRAESWLESEVKMIAARLKHHDRGRATDGATSSVRTDEVTNQTGADDRPPEELLARLTRLVSQKVH
jgi:F0F1-type ATP synthase membrane subunit b/b'